jgi:hypothetical protein
MRISGHRAPVDAASILASVRAPPRGYAPGGVSHSASSLHGGFIWARGVLHSQKRRFPAGQLQGVTAEGDAAAVAVRGEHNAIDCAALSRPVPMIHCGCSI